MRRLPPLLFVLLVVMWLMLNSSLSVGHIVLGGLLATVILLGLGRMRPLHPRIRRLYRAVPLIVTVLIDIIRSNIGVGRVIFGLTGAREVTSGFLDIPLDMRDPHGLAVLATIVTSTPGTVWVALSPDGATLTLHILDLVDEESWIHTIKHRYERPLMEIFE